MDGNADRMNMATRWDTSPGKCLVAKILHSEIANGFVTSVDTEAAKSVEGVIKIVSCFDIKSGLFSLTDQESDKGRVHKRPSSVILSNRIRYYGEPILVVVATSEFVAEQALRLVKVEYSKNVPYFTVDNSVTRENELHEGATENMFGRHEESEGEKAETIGEGYSGAYNVKPTYADNVKGCICCKTAGSITVYSSANGFKLRKTISEALNIPMSAVRVVNNGAAVSDIHYEPLCAFLATELEGQPVMISDSEKQFIIRTPMRFKLQTTLTDNDCFIERVAEITSNLGAYAVNSHGAAVAAAGLIRVLYSAHGSYRATVDSKYSNLSPTWAMQGHGIAHALFAVESHIDDIAFDRKTDPMLLRIKNCIRAGYADTVDGFNANNYNLDRCIIRGRELTDWDNRRKENQNQTGDIRKGLGMAMLCYVEQDNGPGSTVKLTLSPDASLKISLGGLQPSLAIKNKLIEATSEIIGINSNTIFVMPPCDSLPYKNEYSTCCALREATIMLRDMLINHAINHLGCELSQPEIKDGYLIDPQSLHRVLPLYDIIEDMFEQGIIPMVEHYSLSDDKSLSFGVCFAEVSVNIPLCKVEVEKVIVVLDNGDIADNRLLEKQCVEKINDAVAFTLGEKISFDNDIGKPKGCMPYRERFKTDDVFVEFINDEEKNSVISRTVGDAPFVAVAPAIRNAILNATGIKLNSLPITSEKLFEELEQAGLI